MKTNSSTILMMKVCGQLHAPGRFILQEKNHCSYSVGDWVCPSAGLNGVENRKILPLQGIESRPPGL
jgi:hypothetical protein